MSKKSKNYSLAKIKVVGIGGGGNNAISRMSDNFPKSVDLIVINTDVQDLKYAKAKRKIHIGKNLTKGLGTGMNPDLGSQAAEENRSEIAEALKGADMIFITAGEGGGTGTGASPVVADIAREMGILTVAVVTKPFSFEGVQRARIAQEGISKLRERVDTLIVIPNDRIFSLIDKDTSLFKAFERIDEVLKNFVVGITDLITVPGIINVDFADVKAVMQEAGSTIVGIGEASGKGRSITAANQAINSPLLEASIDGAKGVLFGIYGHRDLKMSEINEIAKLISENVDQSAKIIFGAYNDRKLNKGQLKVTLIATGFNGNFNYKNEMPLPGLFGQKTMTECDPEADKTKEEIKAEKESLNREFEFEGFKKKDKADSDKNKQEELLEVPAFLRKKKKR